MTPRKIPLDRLPFHDELEPKITERFPGIYACMIDSCIRGFNEHGKRRFGCTLAQLLFDKSPFGCQVINNIFTWFLLLVIRRIWVMQVPPILALLCHNSSHNELWLIKVCLYMVHWHIFTNYYSPVAQSYANFCSTSVTQRICLTYRVQWIAAITGGVSVPLLCRLRSLLKERRRRNNGGRKVIFSAHHNGMVNVWLTND